MPAVRVNEDVYARLKQLKQRLRHSSFNETVKYLLDNATSPKTFLESLAFWLEDVRNDTKELVAELKQLRENLEKLAD